MRCNQCPRKCNIDRATNIGYCGVGDTLRIARVGLHQWEEPIISGERGSGTIFFAGCNLRCAYCQNYAISHCSQGKDISRQELIAAMKELENQGAHNINLVTANHYLEQIKAALDEYRPSIPICYNTSSYDSIDTLTLLDGYIDIYLADLKYMDGSLSAKLSNAVDYPQVATAAIEFMRKKDDIVEDGIMKQGLIIRHLVLPGCHENTAACLEYITNNMPDTTYVSLMNQYTPMGNIPESLNRKVKPIEYKLAVAKMEKSTFDNVYIQEGCSASKDFIPQWNIGGEE